MKNNSNYDVVIVGGGHNGLVAACYLAMAGFSILILEKNDYIGGATYSKKIFPGIDARISIYSYLISLLPKKILTDLGIHFETRQREIASYTPMVKNGTHQGLLISNVSDDITRQSIIELTGDDREYRQYQKLHEMTGIFAQKVWPTLLSPLPSRQDLQNKFSTRDEQRIWEYLVEKPLSCLIEDHLSDDTICGAIFTNAKIGVSTFPDDPSLLQNRTFIYHIIGQGTGEWRVPVGGMGALIEALKAKALSLGVVFQTSAEVQGLHHDVHHSSINFAVRGKETEVKAHFVLFNTSSDIINQYLPGACEEKHDEGSVFKINMMLEKLPRIKNAQILPKDAFSGTFHLFEGYEHMKTSFQNAKADLWNGGILADALPGEMYCHSLTDPSILSKNLVQKGYHTLTLFGLDVPYHWFLKDNEAVKDEITKNYLRSINHFIEEDIFDCLAKDADGNLCLDVKSPLDLEKDLGLPKGNIFHGDITWPFAETDDQSGTWGVETAYENVYICGSGAKRGGAVSGIPGHNAAMRILG